MDRNVISYQRAQLDGLNQRDLIVMCYRGSIKYLVEAKQRFQAGDVEGFSDLIEKAHRVIFHLYTTLDMQNGGEIAQRLAELYCYIINQTYLLNATKNLDILDGLVKIMTTLKEGWEGIEIGAIAGGTENRTIQPAPAQQVVSVRI